MWKKTIDNKDLFCFERNNKDISVRIEARLNDKRKWDVFKTHYDGDEVNYTEEYQTTSKDHAEKLVRSLMNKKLFTKIEIENIKLVQSKKLNIDLRRSYRDYNMEKWHFFVNDESEASVLFIRDNDPVEMDFIVNEKFRFLEKKILRKVNIILGYEKPDFDISQNIYYYKDRNDRVVKADKKGVLLGKVELGFGNE